MISNRDQVTQMILSAKVRKGLKWADVAAAVGQSKEWTTAACLGQMTFDKGEAEIVGELFDLPDEAVAWLQIAPYRLLKTVSEAASARQK
ncbi:hypothetical protein [Marinobacterium aestuariivivens]|uniref:Cyanate hydratase N-terminal domain-containing protein n=1 Tax=Marinobacterium aestuariivivens TaxID=1698799 RepID=A0ABW1ZWA1_9GAMM